MPERIIDTVTRVWAAVRRHPLASSLLALGVLGWLVLCVMIGMPPWALVGLPLLVGIVAGLLHRLWLRRATGDGTRAGIAAIGATAVATVVVFGLIQLVPYGHNHTDPTPRGRQLEPEWDSPRTRALAVRACFDCHSNQTKYPSYASIAPISWMVQSHVDEGRAKLDFSTFRKNREGADDAIEVIRNGSMPPGYFTAFGRHPEARLTPRELDRLVTGLRATPGFGGG